MNKTIFKGQVTCELLIITIAVLNVFFLLRSYDLPQYNLRDHHRLIYTDNHFQIHEQRINEIFIFQSNLSVYAVCKSQISEPLECNRLSKGRIFIVKNPERIGWIPFVSNNWGNTLSSYWQARGAAFLFGSPFSFSGWNTPTWISYLPVSVASINSSSCVKAYPELFRRLCNNSGPYCDMEYAHKCVGAWNYIRNQILQETRSALERWARLNYETIPIFNRSEMVTYDRCSEDTILDHSEYGPVGFSVFKYIPKTVTVLYYVYDARRTTFFCDILRREQTKYLKSIRPDIIIIKSSGSIWQDFAKLVYAPYVLVTYAGSSFALWATLANIGHVWIPPLYGGMTPDVGSNYHWISTPVLYPSIGKQLNVTKPENISDVNKLIKWLRNI
ncbi:unnamed protein product [Rotaria sp. Silwood2]|nr:unnamed protein product [Rotaria sp. Silwood2]CAF3148230.1 unnamed protein product [Rotaria sp. Silwood2]CAF3446253.1 unnamed protein product [Rotaria sp. Silwood2]